jgi:hypothetical protein
MVARKQVGRIPAQADDAVDKQWADAALSTKYTKPAQGIPTLDIAPQAISVDRIQAIGAPTEKSVLYGDGHWGVILGNFMVIEPQQDYILDIPPGTPRDGEMVVVEIRPVGSDIIVMTVPDEIRLTAGLLRVYEIAPHTSCLVGLRWSDRAGAWHLLTVASEI